MAFGPLYPVSAVPDTSGRVFPNTIYNTVRYLHGMGVEASLGADARWYLAFIIPQPLPVGTLNLHLLTTANTVSTVAKVNPAWFTVNVGFAAQPWTTSPTPEGTRTVSFGVSDNYALKRYRIPLDAYQNPDTIIGGSTLFLDLVFEASGWTVAVVSTWLAYLQWEEGLDVDDGVL